MNLTETQVSSTSLLCYLLSGFNMKCYTGVGSLSLLQQIFPTRELNRGLLHYRQILYHLRNKLFCTYSCVLCYLRYLLWKQATEPNSCYKIQGSLIQLTDHQEGLYNTSSGRRGKHRPRVGVDGNVRLSHLNYIEPGPKVTAFLGLSFLNLKMPVKLKRVSSDQLSPWDVTGAHRWTPSLLL